MVLENGIVHVKETITVNSEQQEIRHGIFRNFNNYKVDRITKQKSNVVIKVISVKRDDKNEPYHFLTSNEGFQLFIGDNNTYLSEGIHTYKIEYSLTNLLYSDKSKDELYFNITGNYWSFPIDEISVSIKLPGDIIVNPENITAFSGHFGEQKHDFHQSLSDDGLIQFKSSRPYQQGEGLTVLVNWDSGIINFKSLNNFRSSFNIELLRLRFSHFLYVNSTLKLSLSCLILLLLYYYIVWRKYGKDPQLGTIIATSRIPDSISPALARFILNMEYDGKMFSVAIINMAIKGWIKITEQGNFSLFEYKNFHIEKTRTQNRENLSDDEQIIYKAFFSGNNSISLKNEPTKIDDNTTIYYNSDSIERINDALKQHQDKFTLDYYKRYFNDNAQWRKAGIILSFLSGFIALLYASPGIIGFALSFVYLIIFAANYILGMAIGNHIKSKKIKSSTPDGCGNIFVYFFSMLFNFMFIAMLTSHNMLTIFEILFLISFPVISGLFHDWLKKPTLKSKSIFEKVLALSNYLGNFTTAKESQSPEHLYDKYLPYTSALGLDSSWNKIFTFCNLGNKTPNQPRWYNGVLWNHAIPNEIGSSLLEQFSTSLNYASSSSSNSSVSGGGYSGGGGGFSGGGGGSSGGGGW